MSMWAAAGLSALVRAANSASALGRGDRCTRGHLGGGGGAWRRRRREEEGEEGEEDKHNSEAGARCEAVVIRDRVASRTIPSRRRGRLWRAARSHFAPAGLPLTRRSAAPPAEACVAHVHIQTANLARVKPVLSRHYTNAPPHLHSLCQCSSIQSPSHSRLHTQPSQHSIHLSSSVRGSPAHSPAQRTIP